LPLAHDRAPAQGGSEVDYHENDAKEHILEGGGHFPRAQRSWSVSVGMDNETASNVHDASQPTDSPRPAAGFAAAASGMTFLKHLVSGVIGQRPTDELGGTEDSGDM
jgi:hypothetical protein